MCGKELLIFFRFPIRISLDITFSASRSSYAAARCLDAQQLHQCRHWMVQCMRRTGITLRSHNTCHVRRLRFTQRLSSYDTHMPWYRDHDCGCVFSSHFISPFTCLPLSLSPVLFIHFYQHCCRVLVPYSHCCFCWRCCTFAQFSHIFFPQHKTHLHTPLSASLSLSLTLFLLMEPFFPFLSLFPKQQLDTLIP